MNHTFGRVLYGPETTNRDNNKHMQSIMVVDKALRLEGRLTANRENIKPPQSILVTRALSRRSSTRQMIDKIY